jgi:hypothetical protein
MDVITRDDVVTWDDRQASGMIDDSIVIVNNSLGEYYDLNRQASDIWIRLATPQRVSELCAALCQQYRVTSERCEVEVLALLNRLQVKGVVTSVTRRLND